jgi:hypothetical protein
MRSFLVVMTALVGFGLASCGGSDSLPKMGFHGSTAAKPDGGLPAGASAFSGGPSASNAPSPMSPQ